MILQDPFDQIRRRRFSVRAGDSDHFHTGAGEIEEHITQHRHCHPAILDLKLRQRDIVQPALHDERRSSRFRRLLRIVMTVDRMARQTNKQISGRYFSRIDRDSPAFRSGIAPDFASDDISR
ncbi:hypothetical protein D1872_219910 [compost metagenome]